MVAGIVLSAGAEKNETPPGNSTPRPDASAPSKINGITHAAVNSGVLTCAGTIDKVVSYLTQQGQSGAFLFTSPDQPDRRVFSASLEITTPNVPLAYASASFAPNQVNGCGGLYETVVYWPNSCDEVATKQFSGLKSIGKLGQKTNVLAISKVGRVFLMPAGEKGCVAIKKELLP